MESDQRDFGGGGVLGSQRVGGKEGVVAPNGPHVGNHGVVDHRIFLIPTKGWEEIRIKVNDGTLRPIPNPKKMSVAIIKSAGIWKGNCFEK